MKNFSYQKRQYRKFKMTNDFSCHTLFRICLYFLVFVLPLLMLLVLHHASKTKIIFFFSVFFLASIISWIFFTLFYFNIAEESPWLTIYVTTMGTIMFHVCDSLDIYNGKWWHKKWELAYVVHTHEFSFIFRNMAKKTSISIEKW